MKTIRVEGIDYRELLYVKHELEIEKMDVVNMSEVVHEVMVRYTEMKNGKDYEDAVEAAKEQRLTPSTEGNVVDVDFDEDSEDESSSEEDVKPKRKTASRKRTVKKN